MVSFEVTIEAPVRRGSKNAAMRNSRVWSRSVKHLPFLRLVLFLFGVASSITPVEAASSKRRAPEELFRDHWIRHQWHVRTPAPLYLASPSQINFVMPRETLAQTVVLNQSVASASATVEVFRGGALIRAGSVQVAPAVPSIFTSNASGSGPATALDAFTFGGPPFAARQANGEPKHPGGVRNGHRRRCGRWQRCVPGVGAHRRSARPGTLCRLVSVSGIEPNQHPAAGGPGIGYARSRSDPVRDHEQQSNHCTNIYRQSIR